MKEDGAVGCPFKYYCTAGRGMEQFVAEEVRLKLSASDVSHVTGKVFFTTSAGVNDVIGLKSAERLFLLLKREAPLSDLWSTGQAGHLLREKIIGDHQVWIRTLLSWQTLKMALGEPEPDHGAEKRGLKRKHLQVETPGDQGLAGGEDCINSASPEDVTSGSSERRGLPEAQTPEEGSVTSSHRHPVAFRVCCRSSGTVGRKFASQDLGRLIGKTISRQLGWRIDLRESDLEVNVHLSDEHCVIGMPLLRLPLSHRTYIKTTGLRSTVAWAMISLADIKPGCLVLDPMCGVGTVLLEAAKEHQNTLLIGMDIDESQLAKALENVQFAELSGSVELLQSSVTAIPCPSCSVDAVVCDVPFGRKFGHKDDMAAHLPDMVKEAQRVLRLGGTLVLLLSPQLSLLLKRTLHPTSAPGLEGDPVTSSEPAAPPPSLQPCGTYRVALGAIDGIIHKYRKAPS